MISTAKHEGSHHKKFPSPLEGKAKREFDEVNRLRWSRLAQKATRKEMRVDRGQVEVPANLPIRGQ